MENMTLSAPWVKFYREIRALFEKDEQIEVMFDEENKKIKLYVENMVKADALEQILPFKREFGNVTVTIEVIPSSTSGDMISLFKSAFDGNPVLAYAQKVVTPMGEAKYAVFKGSAAQFFNDDLSDVNRNCTMLYQDIARDVFRDLDDVFCCTENLKWWQSIDVPSSHSSTVSIS